MTSPASFVFVTGHVFGARALEGIAGSSSFGEGQLSCRLVIGLGEQSRQGTVGYTDAEGLAQLLDSPYRVAHDGSLAALSGAIREAAPDYLIVIGWSRLVASEVLDIPREIHGGGRAERSADAYGCVGMHPTLLPVGRGQAPIPWTLIKQVHHTGLSTFLLEDGADTGGIVQQHPLDVGASETATSLFLRFADLHFHAGRDLATVLANRRLRARRQDEGVASVWPRRRPKDSEISLDQPYGQLESFVRALQPPYPRAYLRVNSRDVRVSACQFVSESIEGPTPSVLAEEDKHLIVQVRDAVARLVVAPSATDEWTLRPEGASHRRAADDD
jgi:methionyl-tRNA formyltransferase